MTPEETKKIDDLIVKSNESLASLQKEVEGKAASIKTLEAKYDALVQQIENTPKKDYVENTQKSLEILEGKIKELKQLSPEGRKSQEQMLVESFTSEKFVALQKKAMKESIGGAEFQTEVKANEITTSGSMTSASGTLIIGQETEPGVARVPWRPYPLWDLVDKGSVGANKNSVGWVERPTLTLGTKMTAENAVFGQSYGTWNKYKVDVKKISDFIKITREDMEDTDYIISEVMDMLNNSIPRIRENQILQGTGAGDNILGILANSPGAGYAKTFAVPTGVKPSNAIVTNVDALQVAITQVLLGNTALAYGRGYFPTAIILNPVDMTNMRLIKDTLGQYIFPAFLAGNGLNVQGVPVIPSFDIAAGTFLVGDFTKAKAFVKRDLTIRMWEQNESDPIYDLVTFTGTQRLAFRIKGIESYAFVTGTFDAAITAIEAAI
jgi:hypothetical protein